MSHDLYANFMYSHKRTLYCILQAVTANSMEMFLAQHSCPLPLRIEPYFCRQENCILSLYIFAHFLVNRGPLCVIHVRIIKNTREIFCIHKFHRTHHLWPLLYAHVALSLSPILAFTPYLWYCISISLFPVIVFGGIQHVSRAQFSSPKPAHFPYSQLSQKTGLPQTHYCVSVHWMCIRAING